MAQLTNSGNMYLGAGGFKVLNTGSGSYTVALNDQSVLGATADWAANVNMVAPSGTITFKAADAAGTAHNLTLTNPISGGASLTKLGGGTLTLLGANTYAGNTTVGAGLLVLGNASALPKATSLTLGDSGTTGILELGGFNIQISGLATGSGGVAANQLITNSSAVNTSMLTFSNSAANSTFGGVIAGGSKPVALTLLGGNLTLSGQNTYAGNIFISNGKLALSGAGSTFTGAAIVLSNDAAILDLTGMNSLALASGQSLSGYGIVTGSVTAASCPITPGANGVASTLAIVGNLTLNGSVTNQFDLLLDPNAAGSDLINVNGALNVSGVNTIKLNPLGGSLPAGAYKLIKCGSIGSGGPANFQITGSAGPSLQATISLTATSVDLTVTQTSGTDRVAMTAVMRKLVILMNRLLKNNNFQLAN
jgi:autotransporter-associated beta strand protein